MFDTSTMTGWDTHLVVFLLRVRKIAASHGVEVDEGGLPEGVRRLIQLATSVPEREGARRRSTARESMVNQIGKSVLGSWGPTKDFLTFIGESFQSLGRLLRGKARFRGRDLLVQLEQTGPRALPIVTLINFLVGVILAFVGSMQLQQFGATIYVANLVAVAMTQEMGAMMTAIIVTGRTGAAYAAELGTMTVNEEIDALTTSGIPPMDFLVLPRLLALVVMMPLLVLYADFIGMLGGAFMSSTLLDVSYTEYLEQTKLALGPKSFVLGLIKATVYGVVVATAGCYRGMRCGRSASAVGSAVTSAVVMGIVSIIVASALLTIIYTILGI